MDSDRADKPPDVMIVSSSVGAGHNQAAAAIIATLKAKAPAVRTEFVDALEFVPWWFRMAYAGGYETAVTRLPRAYGLGYRLANRPNTPARTFAERMRLGLEWRVLRGLREYMLRQKPELVVATHYLAMPMIARLIGSDASRTDRPTGGPDDWRPKMMAVITDYEAHRFWFAANVQRYFAANERVTRQLIPWGVGPRNITVSGIPVHPKWTSPVDEGAVRREWNLPAETPIVLITGGAYFTVGPVERIARGVLAETDAHVIVMAGSNKKLLASLSKLPESPSRLTAVPFTDRLNELARIASVMVTKAGGLITSECFASGVAVVLTKPVPGQEAANADMIQRRGAGVIAPTAKQVVAQVRRLLESPADLEKLRSNARRLFKPAAETIASTIATTLFPALCNRRKDGLPT